MSLANLATDASIKEDADTVGSSFGPIPSGLYNSKVTMAFFGKSKGGAMSLTLHLETDAGQAIRETMWITSGDAKGNLNTYVDKKTGEKKYLPSFVNANNLCLLTVGKEIAEVTAEEKVVKLYSYVERAEVATPVQMLTELIGQEVLIGVLNILENKQVKNDAGVYVNDPSGATREKNEIDKFFRASDRMLKAEIAAGATEAVFVDTWDAKFTGVQKDNSVKVATAGVQSAAFGAASTAKPQASIFAPAAPAVPAA